MTYPICIFAITEQEVTELKQYFIDNNYIANTTSNSPKSFMGYNNKTYLWFRISKPNFITSHQVLRRDTEEHKNELLNTYFTPKHGTIPSYAYMNPDQYPEYFI